MTTRERGRLVAGSLALTLLLSLGGASLRAEDWPEFRGRGRQGVWNETGILERFPAAGLKVIMDRCPAIDMPRLGMGPANPHKPKRAAK